MSRVLVADDDPVTLDVLTFILRREGYDVLPASHAAAAVQQVEQHQPEFGILDVNLGGTSGFELFEQIRQHSPMPMMFLTGRTSEADKVRGLSLGADDYLIKPFGHRELLARVHAHLRRAHQAGRKAEPVDLLQVGPLLLDRTQRTVQLAGQALPLSPAEFRLLVYLMEHAARLIPVAEVAEHLWASSGRRSRETAREALYRLKRTLQSEASNPRLLHTVPGAGIVLGEEAPRHRGQAGEDRGSDGPIGTERDGGA
jgi:DNA-binding response OmpR family regulator